MAHFARVNENWIVEQVIVVKNEVLQNNLGIECDWLGEQFCQQLFGPDTKWIQTSCNGRIYKNFAGIGYTFDPQRNAFISPKPYESWTLDESTCRWESPVPYPSDGGIYSWDEENQDWVKSTDSMFANLQPQT
jgi:hypothetical protein